jgi:hypothetical protein
MKNLVKSKFNVDENKNMLDKYFKFVVSIIQTKNNNIEIDNNIKINNIENNNTKTYYEIIKTKIYEYLDNPSFAPSLDVQSSTNNNSEETSLFDIDQIKYILITFVVLLLLIYVVIKYKSIIKMIKNFRK